jgi:hypothetical protein
MTENMKINNKKNKHSYQNQNRPNLLVVFIVVAVVMGGILLVYYFNNPNQPTVLSLKDNWAALDAKAHQWKNDAYLFNVEYEIPSDDKLMVKYLAPSVPQDEFLISINKSGELVTDPLHLGFEAAVSKPIQLQDFKTDSQEAMAVFAQDNSLSKCPKSSKKQLSMESDLMGFPTWTLVIFDCPTAGKYKTSYLNAQTGQRIGQTVDQ